MTIKSTTEKLAERIRYQVECSAANLVKSGADSEMVRIALGHFTSLADEVSALPQPKPTWVWTKTGTDVDFDPIIYRGKMGDYDGRVTLSRTTRDWSGVLNRGHGKSGFKTEAEAMRYVEDTAASLLKQRIEAARKTIEIYGAF